MEMFRNFFSRFTIKAIQNIRKIVVISALSSLSCACVSMPEKSAEEFKASTSSKDNNYLKGSDEISK